METAYYILNSYLSAPHVLSLLIVFIATLIICTLIAKKPFTHSLLISLFLTYIFFILLITLIARSPAPTRHITLLPFWSWYEVIVNGDKGLAVEIILNIILFVPVGVLMRLLGLRGRWGVGDRDSEKDWINGRKVDTLRTVANERREDSHSEKNWLNAAHVAVFCCCFSFAIELTQYFTCLGLAEWDDVVHNTVGACIGWLVCDRIMRCDRIALWIKKRITEKENTK